MKPWSMSTLRGFVGTGAVDDIMRRWRRVRRFRGWMLGGMRMEDIEEEKGVGGVKDEGRWIAIV